MKSYIYFEHIRLDKTKFESRTNTSYQNFRSLTFAEHVRTFNNCSQACELQGKLIYLTQFEDFST